MLTPLSWLLAASALHAVVPIDWSRYRATPELRASVEAGTLALAWTGENAQPLRLKLNLADSERLIAELSVAGRVILRDAAPAYHVYAGKRRGGWDNFFDTPATRRHEISEHDGKLQPASARVETDGRRLRAAVSGFALGMFRGELVFTIYAGGNLVHQEAVVSTTEPDVAYYYNAALTRCSTLDLNRLYWLGADRSFHTHVLTSDVDLDYVPLRVHRRMLVAEGASGSLAVFPPPHQYFFARDETINYGYVWYRLYRINADPAQGDWFSIGIRQTPVSEQARWVPLVNAPPGSEQRLSLFWHVSPENALANFKRASAYTHDDQFVPLAGRKTFTSHYHVSATMEARRRALAPYHPEFVQVFRHLGVNLVHLMDFHTDGHPRDTGKVRLEELRDYYAETRRLSGNDFLLIPGEEANVHFEGHWNLFLPRPLIWFMRRSPDEPFEDGGVYRTGNAQEMLEVIRRERGLAWQAHPRTKSSTGYPDKIRDTPYYRDPSWLGAGFKAMPSDNSSPRLGERALKLLDDMQNWGLNKFLVGEVDVFKIDRTHELYGHMNINYLKLDRTPEFPDFNAVGNALRRGDYFVTTGEILIHDFELKVSAPDQVTGFAELEWTFPLRFYEIVWGYGAQTHRNVVPGADTGPFERRRFKWQIRCPGVEWARFAVWDVAANGAFTQPVRRSR